MSSLADLLETHAPSLLQRWADRVREQCPPEVQSEPELRDHVPQILKELARAIRRGVPPTTSEYAQEHGRQRFRLGFDLGALVREYGILRGVIFDLAERTGTPIPVAELRVLTDSLSIAVADGVAQHSEEKARGERKFIEDHLRHSRVIADVAQALNLEPERGSMLRRCAEALVEHLEAGLAQIWVLDADGALALEASARRRPTVGAASGGDPTGTGASGGGHAVFPLRAGEREIGRLDFFGPEPLPAETGEALQQAAELIALGLERLRIEADRQRLLVVAEEARAEAELERQRLRALLRQAPVAICIIEGPEHVFTFANDAYRALVRGREVEGKPLLEALPELRGQGFELLLDQVLRTGETVIGNETPVRLEHDGGEQTAILNFAYAPMRAANGETVGVLVTASDVTELAKARASAEAATAELQTIFRSLPDAVYVGGESGIVRANQAALEMLGYEDLSQLNHEIGILAREIQVRRVDTGEPVSAEDQAFSRALRGTPDVQEVLVRNLKTREDRVIRTSCAPIRVGDRVVGAVAINSDITEKRRAEQLLRERADFEKQLIGIVSHDLRNPLSAILLGSERLLGRVRSDDELRKQVVRIRSSAERAVRLVRDLLDFTQSRLGGGIRVAPRRADLHQMTREVLEELDANHAGREVRLVVVGDGQGEWDPDRLSQVIENLVTNALKYSPPGTPVVVTTRGEADTVSLLVHNEGPAIPPSKLTELFEPFHRGDAAAGGAGRSVGLGLFIVKQLVEAHGGIVSARSSDTEGTTFLVRLPRRAALRGPLDASAARQHASQ